MNVLGYIRVSGLSQVDKDGPERQREAIKSFCKTHNLNLMDVFFEAGVSGTKETFDRPALQDLFSAADARRSGEIKAMVVENMDRIARDLMVSEIIFKECRDRKLQVFSIDQGHCNDMASDGGDPTRKLLRQLFGALAEWQKSMLVKRMHHGRMRAKAAGRPWGHAKPLGAKPGEPEAIARIQFLYINEGLDLEQVAQRMNAEGFQTRFKRPWNIYSVLRVLERTTEKREPETEDEERYVDGFHRIVKGEFRTPHTFRVPKITQTLNQL